MMPYAQQALVTAVTDTHLTLQIDAQTLQWPRAPHIEVTPGDQVHLLLLTGDDLPEARNEIAKSLLNSVLISGHENQSEGK